MERWNSRKFAATLFGVVAVVLLAWMGYSNREAAPVVSVAIPAVALMIGYYTHRQGKIDEGPR